MNTAQHQKYLKSEYRNLLQAMRLRQYNPKLTIARAVKSTIDLVEKHNVGDQAGIRY